MKLMSLTVVKFPLMGWIGGEDSTFFREIIKIKGDRELFNKESLLLSSYRSSIP